MLKFHLRLVTAVYGYFPWQGTQGSLFIDRRAIMKPDIHPKYEQTTIRCACGEVIETGSTKQNITVEICSKCHPFYTGKQKLVDTSGRVDKFNKKYGL